MLGDSQTWPNIRKTWRAVKNVLILSLGWIRICEGRALLSVLSNLPDDSNAQGGWELLQMAPGISSQSSG